VRSAGHTVVPIPGPSAVTVALSASGLPADRYLFLGFLPRKGREREQLLRQAAEAPWSVVLFESPHRLGALLTDLLPLAGAGRTVVVARELTKLHEEIRSGTLGELAPYYEESPPRGEITVVLAGGGVAPEPVIDVVDAASRAAGLLATGLTRKEVVQRLIAETGLPRNEAYRIVTALA
jgi:16S rRNA (cytidine1402-2'-O)-methyltransferase